MTTKTPEGTSGQSIRHMSGGYGDSKTAQIRIAQLTKPDQRNRTQRRMVKKGQK